MKELLLTALLGIGVLVLDILNLKKYVLPFILLALATLVGFVVADWNTVEMPFNHTMLVYENGANLALGVFAVVLFFWFILSSSYFKQHEGKTDLYALVVFSFCGAGLLAAFGNMAMLFLGVEILSIPVYVLAASKKHDLASNESGFKYFILGSVASAILLFGITLVYGATGSFDLAVISNFVQDGSETSIIMNVGITMILVGFLFKISAAPFHIWTPDVYQGAPTWITAFMSTLVKAAAMVALFKLFTGPFHYYVEANGYIIGVIAAITLIASNTAALWQTDVKRMLAYSSISHAGFLLSTIIGNASLLSLLFYLLTYSIAGLIAFGVIKETQTLEGNPLKGLYRRNSVLAFAFTAALLSMAGIPPFSGFIAKYFVIAQLIEAKYFALVVVMIITSAIGAFYYLRSSLSVYQHIENAGRIVLTPLVKWTYIVLSALLVLLTVAAGYLHLL